MLISAVGSGCIPDPLTKNMNKQVIPASWHCNGICAGLQRETFVPVLLDSKKSHYLQSSFQFSSLHEFSNDVIIPSSFPPISTFFNCSCLNIKKVLSGEHILVKFPVTVDSMQIKLFYYDNVVKTETSPLISNHDTSADLPSEVTDPFISSTVNELNKNNPNETSLSIDTVPPSPIRISSTRVILSPSSCSKAIGDISTSEDSDDERLDAKLLEKMNELEKTDQQSNTEAVVKSETNESMVKAETNESVVKAETNESVVKAETNKYDNIEDLVVYNTEVRKKYVRRVVAPRSQPKRNPAVAPTKSTSQKRNFMTDVTVVPPKRKGRPSKAFMMAKKTAEIKFKNLAKPVLREKKGLSDDSCEEAAKNKVQNCSDLSKVETKEQDGMEENSIEKPEAPVEHPPIVERNAIDLVRKKLERLKGKRSKEPETIVENLFGDTDEEKPLFTMDDNFLNGSSNIDIAVPSNSVQESSPYVLNTEEDLNNLGGMQDEIEPSSATSSISSEGALVVHDILFDDL
ncbi:unnamed protein product [Auanema sp. JU1783]|nr:unnamed protein product [Auanema sp. JU1783]